MAPRQPRGSEARTTSTTSSEAKPTFKKKSAAADEPKLLTNLVRDSEKAAPRSAAEEPLPTSDSVGTVDKPKDEPMDTTQPDTASIQTKTDTGKDAPGGLP
jgi:hypothetical protein